MQTEIHQYIRDRKGRRAGVMIAYKDGSHIGIGYSVCNKKAGDKWNPERGIGMAKARAEKSIRELAAISQELKVAAEQDYHFVGPQLKELVVPPGYKSQIDDFVARADRYFKQEKPGRHYRVVAQNKIMTQEENNKLKKVMADTKIGR